MYNERVCKPSKHSIERIIERTGVKKEKNAKKKAKEAFQHGILHSEVSGDLLSYLNSIYLRHKKAKNIRLYEGSIYLFTKDKVLLTVYPIPPEYYKWYRKAEIEIYGF